MVQRKRGKKKILRAKISGTICERKMGTHSPLR